ncbi:MAG: methyltransferase, partial [Myxococcales bacterium]|nr:methyltransferase [Myxococcales bacterium]
RLVEGGVLLVDDYGQLEGATRAVDEYLAAQGVTMMLTRLDSQGCVGIKPPQRG